MPPLLEAEYRLAEKLLADRGEANPADALKTELAKIRAEGKAQTTPAALRYLIQELGTVESPLPELQGVVLGARERTTRVDYIVGTEEGCFSVSGLPEPAARWSRIRIQGATLKEKKDTGTRWVELNGGTVSTGDPVKWADVSRLVTALSKIQGRNVEYLISGTVRFVNASPKEKYDKDKPFQKGQKVETRPVYNPIDKSFSMRLTIQDGQHQLSVTLTDMAALEGLYPPGELTEKYWSWFTSDKTPDTARLEELSGAIVGQNVVILGSGSSEINGQKTTKPVFNLRGGGWVRLKELLVDQLNGTAPAPVGPGVPPPGEEDGGLPPPATPTIRGELQARLEANGVVAAKDLKEIAALPFVVAMGKGDQPVKDEILKLEAENFVHRSGGKFLKKA
jgi:hypothetical protein